MIASNVGRLSISSANKALLCTSACRKSDHPNLPSPEISSKIAAFRKGTGGRCSFSGNVVSIFGATGLLGLPVINHFAKHGHQIIVPSRQEPYYTREIKVLGELGQVLILPFLLNDEDSIRRAIKYSNVVVNMMGTRYQTGNYSFEDVHVKGAQTVARIAKEMGIQKLVHVSAMNATKNPPKTFLGKPSEFLRTKALGEEAVRDEFPEATIIRPSVVFGDESDTFIYFYMSNYRYPYGGKVRIYNKGEKTYKMPVYYGDVARGIERAASDENTRGKTYEFVGPHCYKLSELVDYMFERAHLNKRFYVNYRRRNHSIPFKIYVSFMERFYNLIKLPPPLSPEWIRFIECTNDTLTGCPTLSDLGFNRLTDFELAGGARAYGCVYRYDQKEPDPREPYHLPLRSPPIYAINKDEREEIFTETKPFKINTA